MLSSPRREQAAMNAHTRMCVRARAEILFIVLFARSPARSRLHDRTAVDIVHSAACGCAGTAVYVYVFKIFKKSLIGKRVALMYVHIVYAVF